MANPPETRRQNNSQQGHKVTKLNYLNRRERAGTPGTMNSTRRGRNGRRGLKMTISWPGKSRVLLRASVYAIETKPERIQPLRPLRPLREAVPRDDGVPARSRRFKCLPL